MSSTGETTSRRLVATLDRWRFLLTTPQTLAFPHLELMGRDHAPPIVVGVGEVRLPNSTEFAFTLTGLPADIGYAFGEIVKQQRNPYDGLARFRLTGLDALGVRWSLGWTVPRVELGEQAWTFVGDTDTLMPHDQSDTVSSESSTEAIFLVPVNHPMALALGRFVLTAQPGGRPLREHAIEVLGSTIRFTYEPTSGALSVTATHSADLPPAYAENWLGEPLRILFGQLLAPRLVARNLGGGRTHVFVRPASNVVRGASWAALWNNDSGDKEAFWGLYRKLLSLIALARDAAGQCNWEAHKITKLYEEIIQASQGSRLVWAMTFASSIEGLANLLAPPGQRRDDANEKAIASLVKHINTWSGDRDSSRTPSTPFSGPL
jgi:hypothetical protein